MMMAPACFLRNRLLRRWWWLILLLALTLAPAPSSVAQQMATVRVTIPARSTSQLVPVIADKLNFYREVGIQLDLSPVRAGQGIRGVIGKSFEYSTATGAATNAFFKGAPLQTVMVTVHKTLFDLMGRQGVTSIKQLKGKTIGVTSLASSMTITAKIILQKNGIDPDKDVTFMAVGGGGNRMAALKVGSVHAAVMSSPANLLARKMGYTSLAFFANDPSVNIANGGFAARTSYLRDKPGEVKRFLAASLKALKYLKANKAETVKIMQEFLRLKDPAFAGRVYDLIAPAYTDDGLMSLAEQRNHIAILKRGAKVTKDFDPKRLFDFHYLREAQ